VDVVVRTRVWFAAVLRSPALLTVTVRRTGFTKQAEIIIQCSGLSTTSKNCHFLGTCRAVLDLVVCVEECQAEKQDFGWGKSIPKDANVLFPTLGLVSQ